MGCSTTAQHVLIIGAGLTGLLVAHGLDKARIPYTIFEAEDEGTYRLREWSMGIHWSVPLLEKLLPPEIWGRVVKEATVDPSLDYTKSPCNGSRIYDGVTGEVLKELGGEGVLMRVSRRKLRGLIGEGVKVKWGARLKGYEVGEKEEEGVTAVFEDGEVVRGSCLVGCDGPKSAVRSLLVPGEEGRARSLEGIVHMSTTLTYGDASKAEHVRSAHLVWSMSLHPDIFAYVCAQDVPDPKKPEDWKFFVFMAWKGARDPNMTAKQARQLVRQKAEAMHEPFRSAVLWIPEDVEVPFVDVGYWVAKNWDSPGGRVTLAGDAAHPMPPYRGQGLNHAIQDACNFVRVMEKVRDEEGKGREELVKEYGDEVAKRGAEETQLSMKNAYMLLSYDDFKESPYNKHGLSKQ